MKFNIKNCPAYNKLSDECDSKDTQHICCWMNEDCLMKQIVQRYQQNVSDLLETEEVYE